MSFGLTVLAMGPAATPEQARLMVRQCHTLNHVEGELDPRIQFFYEELIGRFPGHDRDTPWADSPAPGIDHVHMWLRYGGVSDGVIEVVQELAAEYSLVIYDPQGDDVYLPDEQDGEPA